MQKRELAKMSKTMTQTYELSKECLQINYCGAKRTAEALIPLLQLSDSPRIVNVSSTRGKLQVCNLRKFVFLNYFIKLLFGFF